jgi:hypothetical protein
MDESRELIRQALDMAFGSYVEQEGKKADSWRDTTIGDIYGHLKHELEEVNGNLARGELGFLVHNAMDVIELGAILLALANIKNKERKEVCQ